ncbi:DHDH family protein [Megaselia abdita]
MIALNWGLVGTSKISHDFHSAIVANYTDLHHQVLAVASRTKRRAELFAKEHNIVKAYDNYEDLANNESIEVVYIGSSSFLHYELCKIMINSGKHVLCEAPIGLTFSQVDELLKLSDLKNVVLMTGLWSRFFPAYSFLEELLRCENLGEVKDVYVKIGHKIEDKNKITDKKIAGGVTYSMVYTALQFILFVYREFPKTIRAQGKINQFGIDMYVEVDLIFSNGRTATLICSGIETIRSQANIIGKKGVLIFPTFESPTNAIFGTHKQIEWPFFEVKTPFFFKNRQGLRYEADELWKCIKQKRFYSEAVPNQDVIDLAKIVDEIRKQLAINLNGL